MNNKTISFFKEISNIPRESGNEKAISNYICEFAKKRNLNYLQDEYGNVIIKKYNGKNEPIIFQAHLDMVCEKDNNNHDFRKDPIEVYEAEGYLRAKGTTLGADNGIGVAQILNILDDSLKLNIEAIFTVSEETSMCGAENIDLSTIKGRLLINLDGFNKKTIITESACFYDIIMNLNYELKEQLTSSVYKIKLDGMPGGHSGFDIDKNKGNSCIELARFLNQFKQINISNFLGGTKFNVIPSQAECEFSTNLEIEQIYELINDFKNDINNRFEESTISFEKIEKNYRNRFLSDCESARFLNSIISFKHGVYSKTDEGLITTSENLGVVNLEENIFKIGVRSSRKNELDDILKYLDNFADQNNYKIEVLGNQPGFETRNDSKLIKALERAYNNSINDGKLIIIPSHVTLECGFFTEKIADLEVAIISPQIIDAHTTNERVEIESIDEFNKWIYEFLKNLK